MENELRRKFNQLWQDIGVSSPPPGRFDELWRMYNEPTRHYHTPQHILHSLEDLEALKSHQPNLLNGESWSAVGIALCYHDAVYDTRSKHNEEKSADLCVSVLDEAHVPTQFSNQVWRLIIATKAHSPGPLDEQVIVDIDLAILGQPWEQFALYDNQIREEYDWVSWEQYQAGRTEVLQSFLNKPRIFSTDYFFNLYENQTRLNLERALRQLQTEV